MELITCKEKTQKGETTWSLHLWSLRGSKHSANPDEESKESGNLFKPVK